MKIEPIPQVSLPPQASVVPPWKHVDATVNEQDNRAVSLPSVPESPREELKVSAPSYDKKLRIRFDGHHDEILVQVVDEETQEVLKELPPEEIRRMHRRIRAAVGLLIDRSA